MPSYKNLTQVRIDWKAVANLVGEITHKSYDPQYIRDCAKGTRTNKTLKPILENILKDLKIN